MPKYTFYLPQPLTVPPTEMASINSWDVLYAKAQNGSGAGLEICPGFGGEPPTGVGEDKNGGPLGHLGSFNVCRTILRFHTSLLAAAGVTGINSAKFQITAQYTGAAGVPAYSDELWIVEATGTHYPVITADFVTLNPFVASKGSIAYAFPPSPGHSTFVINLNAGGLALLSTVADISLALKTLKDINMVSPNPPPPPAFKWSYIILNAFGVMNDVFTATRSGVTTGLFSETLKESIPAGWTGATKLELDVNGISHDMANIEVRFNIFDGTNTTYTAWKPAVVGVAVTDTAPLLDPALTYFVYPEIRYNQNNATLFSAALPIPVNPWPKITATAGTGGTISPIGTVYVQPGSDHSYAITPSAGYQISDVYVNGVSQLAIASYTFFNVLFDSTIDAQFIPVVSQAHPLSRTDVNPTVPI